MKEIPDDQTKTHLRRTYRHSHHDRSTYVADISITISESDARSFIAHRLGSENNRPSAGRIRTAIARALENGRGDIPAGQFHDYPDPYAAHIGPKCRCGSTDHYHASTCPLGPDDRHPASHQRSDGGVG